MPGSTEKCLSLFLFVPWRGGRQTVRDRLLRDLRAQDSLHAIVSQSDGLAWSSGPTACDLERPRLTARALGIRTEASGRFERGVCVETTMEAMERALKE